jgi:hypothetical protein
MDVDTLFKRAGSDAKGRYVSPQIGSSEWNQWLSWANEELDVFAEIHDWPEYKKVLTISSSGISGTSLALPDNFKKAAGSVQVGDYFYNEVDYDNFDKYTSDDKVFRHGWDDGWYLELNQIPASDVIFPIQHYPTSLATSTDRIVMRNPSYLVKRLKVRIFKYRQDPIFTEIESEADLLLQQMIENEYYKHSQYKGGSTTREEEAGFTLGLD